MTTDTKPSPSPNLSPSLGIAPSIGSETAKGGFKCEDDVIKKFLNWETDLESYSWLEKIHKDMPTLKGVNAYNQVKTREILKELRIKDNNTFAKADVTVWTRETGTMQKNGHGISVKRISTKKEDLGKTTYKGFNQIDRGFIKRYKEIWNIPEDICKTLSFYTGEEKHNNLNTKDNRRLYFDELPRDDVNLVIKWFEENKLMVVKDILMGRGARAADWLLVGFYTEEEEALQQIWTIKSIQEAIYYYMRGPIELTEEGNLTIGRIKLQRKGGDNGKDTANQLQFKFDPSEMVYYPKIIEIPSNDLEQLTRSVLLKS